MFQEPGLPHRTAAGSMSEEAKAAGESLDRSRPHATCRPLPTVLRRGVALGMETRYRACIVGEKASQRILGIDPGVRSVGYGVIDARGRDASLVAYGTVDTSTDDTFPNRLLTIYQGLSGVIEEHKPERMVCEKLVYHRNVSVALGLGQARGVALLAAAMAGLPMEELSPTEIKKSVAGKGQAHKLQVQKMVQLLLGLPEPPDSEHAADALAAALAYVHSCHMKALLPGEQR